MNVGSGKKTETQEEGTAGQPGQGAEAEAGDTEAAGQGGTAQAGSVLQMEDVAVQTVQALENKGRIVISGGTTAAGTPAEGSAAAGNPAGGALSAGNLSGGAPAAAKLLVGDGTVIVMVACAEGGYTAGTNDAVAVVNAVLTPEQIKLVNEGETIEVRVDIRDISESMPPQDMETVEKGCEVYGRYLPDLKLGGYVDISVYMKTGDSGWNAVTETREPIEVVIGIPEELQGDGREYYIIRAHENRYALLNDMDEVPETITIITDMFSSYVIAYREAGAADGRAVCRLCHICPTFLGVCCFIWLAAIVAAAIGAVIVIQKRKKGTT